MQHVTLWMGSASVNLGLQGTGAKIFVQKVILVKTAMRRADARLRTIFATQHWAVSANLDLMVKIKYLNSLQWTCGSLHR